MAFRIMDLLHGTTSRFRLPSFSERPDERTTSVKTCRFLSMSCHRSKEQVLDSITAQARCHMDLSHPKFREFAQSAENVAIRKVRCRSREQRSPEIWSDLIPTPWDVTLVSLVSLPFVSTCTRVEINVWALGYKANYESCCPNSPRDYRSA